ncbi:MAG: endonuclease/exonuclease/phosphatase family protein [Chromatiales bacterium]|jgi:exodeoxyribonuclease-3|nr:endonuclease/exonuclease/phosphatase family protein [Chromatiales bacterium]
MKIYSWNVNGIRSVIKQDHFMPFIVQHAPDVLCLQQTKTKRGQVDVTLPGYHEYWNAAQKSGYAGTAICSRHEGEHSSPCLFP